MSRTRQKVRDDMTEMYGSYSDEDLNEWERMPQNIRILTSSAFGAWLLRRDMRRDKRIKPQEPKTDTWSIKEVADALEKHGLLEQEPCEDAISREAVLAFIKDCTIDLGYVNGTNKVLGAIMKLPSVKPKARVGHCKDCKYFEYDSVAKVDGIPLIVAHEICSKWADGCKTKEDGYCFLFEPKESEDKE